MLLDVDNKGDEVKSGINCKGVFAREYDVRVFVPV
jgi:hypothetical protein